MSLLKKNTKQSKANKQQKNEPKLNYEMQREIEDAFSFYDPKKTKQINRDNLKCILGNFGFQQAAASQIDQFLQMIEIGEEKNTFELEEVMYVVSQKWLKYGGQKQESEEIFALFDIDDNKLISYNELKGMFQKYLDININDQDIHDFITEHDTNDDQKVSKEELLTALNYDLTTQ